MQRGFLTFGAINMPGRKVVKKIGKNFGKNGKNFAKNVRPFTISVH